MHRALSIPAMVLALCLAASVGSAKDPVHSGFLGDTYRKLEPGPEGGALQRWFKPNTDFSKYRRVMIDSVIFYYADKSEDKGIDGNEMKELADAFNLEMVSALKDGYAIVSDPAPDVLRIRPAITNIKKSKPVRSAISSVVPVGIGISVIRKGATDAWTGAGSTAVELMGVDSVSGDIVAAAVDERSAGYTERFSSLGSAKEAFKFWAQRIRTLLDHSQRLANLRADAAAKKPSMTSAP